MNNISTLFKLNGLIFLLLGALFVFIPEHTIVFLSELKPAPEAVVLSAGVVFNLSGLLLLWLGKQSVPSLMWLKIIAIINSIWVIACTFLIINKLWISSINGITAAGITAIVLAWFAWLLWQHAK